VKVEAKGRKSKEGSCTPLRGGTVLAATVLGSFLQPKRLFLTGWLQIHLDRGNLDSNLPGLPDVREFSRRWLTPGSQTSRRGVPKLAALITLGTPAHHPNFAVTFVPTCDLVHFPVTDHDIRPQKQPGTTRAMDRCSSCHLACRGFSQDLLALRLINP
jgi:hypothetical protein